MNDIAKITGKTTEWLIHGDRETPDLLGAVEPTGIADLRAQVERLEARLADLTRVLSPLAQLDADEEAELRDWMQRHTAQPSEEEEPGSETPGAG
jgi:hypothetical protein